MIFELADPDGALRAAVRSPLTVERVHAGWIEALAVVEHDGAPLIITAGNDRELRSWRLDGTPGPLTVNDARQRRFGAAVALAVVEHDGAPLIITAGNDRELRSWRLDGTPGPLTVNDAHQRRIRAVALAVVEHDGAPLIITAGSAGSLRSWRLDGTPGPLTVNDAHQRRIGAAVALAVVEHDGAPLIITAGDDGSVRSWRLDGSPGEFAVDNAHPSGIVALAVVEHDGAPLIITAGDDRELRSWRVGPGAWMRLGGPLAAQLEVRRLSLGSLELEVLVPAVSAVPAALGFVLYAFKRLWTFRVELRIHTLQMRARLREAERELERLEDTGEVDDVVEAARDAVIRAWNVIDATLSDDEDQVG